MSEFEPSQQAKIQEVQDSLYGGYFYNMLRKATGREERYGLINTPDETFEKMIDLHAPYHPNASRDEVTEGVRRSLLEEVDKLTRQNTREINRLQEEINVLQLQNDYVTRIRNNFANEEE